MTEAIVEHLASTEGPGGVNTALAAQCSAMRHVGIESRVTYLVQKEAGEIAQTFQDHGITYRVGCGRMPTFTVLSRLILKVATGDNSLRILHIHSGLPVITPKVDFLRGFFSRRVPVVVTLHGPSDLYPYSRHKEMWDRHRLLIRKWFAVVVPSESEAEIQRTRCPGHPSILSISNACLNIPERLRLRGEEGLDRAESPVVVTVARLAPEKNVIALLAAFPLVAAKVPQVRLMIVGDGPMRGELESRVTMMPQDVRERIKFYGHVPYPQRLLSSETVFVSLSTAESFGLVAVEAALAGAPLLLSKIRPWTDYFEDRADCVFANSSETTAVADELVKLLTMPHYRRELAERGKAKASLISSEAAIGAAWRRLYSSLLRG